MKSSVVYAGVLLTVFSLAFGPDRWWAWVLAVMASGLFGVYVHRTAERWREALDSEIVERQVAAPIDKELHALAEHGFGSALLWTADSQTGAYSLSADRTVVAHVSSAWRGPLLTTRWDEASLATSNGEIGAPLRRTDYLQALQTQDLAELIAAHREAADVLGCRYGSPVRIRQLSTKDANKSARRRRAEYETRRYRQTAKVMIVGFLGGYRGRLSRRLASRGPIWLRILPIMALLAMLIWTWVIAIPDAIPLGVGATFLYGGLCVGALLELREQRRFR